MPKSIKTEHELSGKEVRSPWTFSAPSYDGRNLVSAGNHFGVGHINPVGHADGIKQHVDSLPQERYSKPI